MSISIAQTWAKTRNASTASPVPSGNSPQAVASGNTILVAVAGYNFGVTYTCADNIGNSYAADVVYTVGSAHLVLFRASNVDPGSNAVITVTPSASTAIVFGAIEVAGLANSSPLDGGNTGTGTSTAPAPGTFTTTNANDLLLNMYLDVGGGTRTITPPSGSTSFCQEPSSTYIACDFDWQIVSTVQTNIAPTWTLNASETWLALTQAYMQASSGPPKFTPEQLAFAPMIGMH